MVDIAVLSRSVGSTIHILFLNSDGTVKSDTKIAPGLGGFPSGEMCDSSLVLLGDLDRDGFPELACGSRADDDGSINAGAVWILFLLPDGTAHHTQKISDTEGGFVGSLDSSDFFGTSVAALGDHNGDGVVDLVVGAHGDDAGATDTGAVWVLFLKHDRTIPAHQKISAICGQFFGAHSLPR